MKGDKWEQVLINAVALGYVSLNMDNIDILISIRTTGDVFTRGQILCVPMIVIGIYLIYYSHLNKNLKNETVS